MLFKKKRNYLFCPLNSNVPSAIHFIPNMNHNLNGHELGEEGRGVV